MRNISHLKLIRLWSKVVGVMVVVIHVAILQVVLVVIMVRIVHPTTANL
jgi:hypothetical protein